MHGLNFTLMLDDLMCGIDSWSTLWQHRSLAWHEHTCRQPDQHLL
jgi:hypothetical protein